MSDTHIDCATNSQIILGRIPVAKNSILLSQYQALSDRLEQIAPSEVIRLIYLGEFFEVSFVSSRMMAHPTKSVSNSVTKLQSVAIPVYSYE